MVYSPISSAASSAARKTVLQSSATQRQTQRDTQQTTGGKASTSTLTTANAGASPKAALVKLLSMLMTVLVAAKKKTAQGTTNDAAPASGPKQDASTSTPANANRPLTIAHIDDFSTDNTGFNHGREIDKVLNPDGKTNLINYDINKGGKNKTQNISNALDDVLTKVKSGQQIDAVEIPLTSGSNNRASAAIRNKIEQLHKLGVPVIVAAGNDGANTRNFLEAQDSFNVENTVNGQLSSHSGKGNIQFDGRTTSFASAALALQVAQLRHQGESSEQIFSQLA